MKKDALLVNKIAAAVLCAGLLGMVTAELSNMLYSPKMVDTNAYTIAELSDVDGTQTVDAAPLVTGPADIKPLLASATLEDGQRSARKCAACHTFEQGEPHRVGPNLWGTVDLDKGGHEGYAYSEALAADEGAWTYDSLNEFLYAPEAYLPGTKMNFRGIKNDEERAALILYLRSLAEAPVPLP